MSALAGKDSVRQPGDTILDQVKRDEGKAYALKKVTGTIASSGQEQIETVDSVAENAFGVANEIRRDLRHWFSFPTNLNDCSERLLNKVEMIETPLKFVLIIICILLAVLIVRIIIEMILDTVDMCTYVHEEDAKKEPEVVIAKEKTVKSD